MSEHYGLVLRLLFDPDLRARVASGDLEGVPERERALLAGVDLAGLEIDAQARSRYLMSALCRSYPLTAAALGSRVGPEPIEAFLASFHVFSPLAERSQAFGEHLRRLIGMSGLESPLRTLLTAALNLEQGLVQSASALRAVATAGQAPPPPSPARPALGRRGRIQVPTHAIVAELPVSTGVLRAALEGVTAEDAWARVRSGQLHPGRLLTVARSEPSPTTFLGRAFLAGDGVERGGAGGVAPLIEVRHRTLELRGALARAVAALDGQDWRALTPPNQRLADILLESGLIEAR